MSHDTSVLSAHPKAPSAQPPETFTYYHAGPLFNLGDLYTNTRLASAIHAVSKGRYKPVLPQDLEQRDTTPHSIRDQDIQALLSCDLALFTYDGVELDSGTVVEYMIAKFADIPSVIVRTDFRGGGDQASHSGDPWNLMSSFWPRTKGVVINSMSEYKVALAKALAGHVQSDGSAMGSSEDAGSSLLQSTATQIVDALNEVVQMPPRLPHELRPAVYQWLAIMPGFKAGSVSEKISHMRDLLTAKEQNGMLR